MHYADTRRTCRRSLPVRPGDASGCFGFFTLFVAATIGRASDGPRTQHQTRRYSRCAIARPEQCCPAPRGTDRAPGCAGLARSRLAGKGFEGGGARLRIFRLPSISARLPLNVKVCSFRFDGNLEAKDSEDGILCAEVIHALAPEAELLLVNWEPERPDQFLAAVRWRGSRERIFSCSIVMPTWSDCEGHGRIHEELAGFSVPARACATLCSSPAPATLLSATGAGPLRTTATVITFGETPKARRASPQCHPPLGDRARVRRVVLSDPVGL